MNISGKQYAPVISLNAQLNSHSILEIQSDHGAAWRNCSGQKPVFPSTGCAQREACRAWRNHSEAGQN